MSGVQMLDLARFVQHDVVVLKKLLRLPGVVRLDLVDDFARFQFFKTSQLCKNLKPERILLSSYSMAESLRSSSFSGVGGEPVGKPVMLDDCGKLTGAGPKYQKNELYHKSRLVVRSQNSAKQNSAVQNSVAIKLRIY